MECVSSATRFREMNIRGGEPRVIANTLKSQAEAFCALNSDLSEKICKGKGSRAVLVTDHASELMCKMISVFILNLSHFRVDVSKLLGSKCLIQIGF